MSQVHQPWQSSGFRQNFGADVDGLVPGGYSVGQNQGRVGPNGANNDMAKWGIFFGVREPTTNNPRPKATFDLPEAYNGENPYLSTIIMNEITQDQQYPTTELLPYKLAEDRMTIQFDEWIFHRHLLDRVPEEMTVKLTTSTKDSRVAYMVRYGLGFLLEHGFFNTIQGIEQYKRNIKQIKYATIETACFNVLWEIMSCERYGSDSFIQTMREQVSVRQLRQVIKEEVHNYARLVKGKNAWASMMTHASKQLQKRGVNGARYVVIAQGGRALVSRLPENSEFLSSGRPTGLRDVIGDSGWNVRESRGFVTGERTEDFDPLIRPKSVGEFVHMGYLDHIRDRGAAFTTESQNVQVYNEDEDDYAIIRFMDALEKTGLWSDKSHTQLSALGRRVFAGQTSYLDWFKRAGVLEDVKDAMARKGLGSFAALKQGATVVNQARAQGAVPNKGVVPVDTEKLAKDVAAAGADFAPLAVAVILRSKGADLETVLNIVNGRVTGFPNSVANAKKADIGNLKLQKKSDAVLKSNDSKLNLRGDQKEGYWFSPIGKDVAQNQYMTQRGGPAGPLWAPFKQDSKVSELKGKKFNNLAELQLAIAGTSSKSGGGSTDALRKLLHKALGYIVTGAKPLGAQGGSVIDQFVARFANQQVGHNQLRKGVHVWSKQVLDFVKKNLKRLDAYDEQVKMVYANYVIRQAAASAQAPSVARTREVKKFFVVCDIALTQLEDVTGAALDSGDDQALARLEEYNSNFSQFISAAQYDAKMISDVVQEIPADVRNNTVPLVQLAARLREGKAVELVINSVKNSNNQVTWSTTIETGYEQSYADLSSGGNQVPAIRERDGGLETEMSKHLIERNPELFWELAKRDIPTGIDIILARPHWTHQMGSAFLCTPGAALGNTWIGHAMFFLGDDPKRAMHNGSFFIYIKALVMHPRNIYYMEDCMPVDYVSGGGVDFWCPKKHQAIYRSGNGTAGDIFALAVPSGFKCKDGMIDLRGHFDPVVVRNARAEEAHYPTCGAYASFWGWSTPPNAQEKRPAYFSKDFYRQLTESYNLLCLRGYSATVDKDGKFTHVVVNKGHWGPNVYPGCGQVRCGREVCFETPTYRQIRTVRVK